MTPADAARLLAVAGTFDPRLRPPTPEDAEARSLAWAGALDADMSPEWAQRAVVKHYADTTEAVMPAHVNRAWRAHRRAEAEREASRRALDTVPGVPMPDEIREQIAALRSKTRVEA
jgi:hypothetical protein